MVSIHSNTWLVSEVSILLVSICPLLVISRKPIKNSIGPLKDENSMLISSDLGKANLLNRYFTNVFSVEDNSLILEPAIRYEGSQILDKIIFTVSDIIR